MTADNSDLQSLITNIDRKYTPLREVIKESWNRSSNYGLKTNNFKNKVLLNRNEIELRISKNKDFNDKFDQIFSEFRENIGEISAVFFITDKEGYVLSAKNHLNEFVNLKKGENFSEFYLGTNAAGLTLYSNQPATVKAEEHYFKYLTAYNSTAYPILDQYNNLKGCIAAFYTAELDNNLLEMIIKLFAFTLTDKIPADKILKSKNDKSAPKTGSKARYSFADIITNSKNMKKAIEVAQIAARNDSTVMLVGESGTGKEMFAQAIHNYNHRKNSPFVAVNVGAVPKDLVESEFFGYEEGAFTGARRGGRPGKFELANGGTIFLDEIEEMTLSAQQNLLRVIQEREVTRIGGTHALPIDVRIITATKSKLIDKVKKGEFREDLYYRLNVIRIPIPNLKDRRDDIMLLVNNFIKIHCQKFGIPVKKVAKISKKYFLEYNWPGNVRELENMIEGIITFALDDEVIKPKHLPRELINSQNTKEKKLDLMSLEAAEKTAVTKTYIKERPVQAGGVDNLGTVKGESNVEKKPVDVDDEFMTMLKFENGAVGSIEATRNAWGRNNFLTFEIHGEKGSLYFNYERRDELQVCFTDQDSERKGYKTLYTGPAHPYGENLWPIPALGIGYGETKIIEVYEFIKSIVEDTDLSPNFEDGYRIDVIADGILKSASKESWVSV
jgi:transcriptional regulator with PAS, ATPase and Fis domain